MLSVLVLAAALLATPARSASDLLTSDQRAWLAEHPDLVIGFPENQPPAVVTAQDGRMEGVFVEYLNLLNRRLGTDIRAELGPWPDLVERAERREIDMLGFTFRLAAHRTHFEFTDTVIKTYYYIYTRSDDPDPPGDLAALSGKRVGYIAKTRIVEAQLAGRDDLDLVPFPDHASLAAALLSRRIDAIVSSISLEYWRKTYTQTGFRVAAMVPEMGGDLVIAVRKDWRELVGILNAGLATISPGERQAIMDRWLGSALAPQAEPPAPMFDETERAWLAETPVVRVGIDPAWAPVAFVDEDGNPQGISIAYIRRLEDRLGVRFELVPTRPWSEAVAQLAAGNLDVLPATAAAPERQQTMRLTDPYVRFPAAIFSAADVAYIGGLEALAGKTVAVIRDDVVQEWLQRNSSELDLLPVTDTREALRRLAQGDADAFVGNLVTTSYYIGQSGLTRIKVVGETPFEYRLGMAVNRNQPILAGILQKGLDAIPRHQRDAIYHDWISIRYSHATDWGPLWQVIAGAALLIALIGVWNRRLVKEIDRRRRAEDALREAKESADAANKAKSTFLANISHELRTPLNLVLGFASMLNGRERNDRERGWLKGIDSAGTTLAHLIDDLLDLSRIEAGRVEIGPAPTDLRALCHDLTAMFAQSAAEKGLTLTLAIDDSVPAYPTLDPKYLRQILVNLLGNAIKFTDSGRVELGATVTPAGAGASLLSISVKDTGRGIDRSEQGVIFESFARGSASDQPGGAGLGLTISRRLAQLMGGDITVRSAPGCGSTFTLELPAHAVDTPDAIDARAVAPSARPGVRLAPGSVLIVDDRADNRNLLRQYLDEQPLDVIEAESGVEALELARQQRPDLILMDLAMPGMDGETAAARLKAEPATAHIPIVAATATATTDCYASLQRTFDAVLHKPLSQATLLDCFARWLAAKVANDGSTGPRPMRLPAECETPPLELSPDLHARLVALKPESASVNDIEDFAAAVEREADSYGDADLRRAAAEVRCAAERFDPGALRQRLETFQKCAHRRPATPAAIGGTGE